MSKEILDEWFIEPQKEDSYTFKQIAEINRIREPLGAMWVNEPPHPQWCRGVHGFSPRWVPEDERRAPSMPEGHTGKCECCRGIRERINLVESANRVRAEHPEWVMKRLLEDEVEGEKSTYVPDSRRKEIEEKLKDAWL